MSGKINKSINEHCEQVIDLLFNKGPSTLEDIMERLQKKKRTAQNIVSVLAKSGIITKNQVTKRYDLTEKAIIPDCNDQEEYEISDKKIVEAWLILFILSSEKIYSDESVLKRKEQYENTAVSNITSNRSFYYEMISYLSKKGYISMQHAKDKIHNRYELDVKAVAPIPIFLNDDDIFLTFPEYYQYYEHAKDEGNTLKKIAEKIKQIIPDYSIDTFKEYKTSGRFNIIDDDIKKKLDDFLKLNFKKNVIEIKFIDSEGKQIKTLLNTGLIVYSAEKNSFYLFGIDNKNEYTIIRIDTILEAKETETENAVKYNNKDFTNIFRRMYSISIEAPEPVEILFKNESHIRSKIKAVSKIRKDTSSIKPLSDSKEINSKEANLNDWFLYKDEISGLSDFLPYVRSFGSSAVIIKPEREQKNTINKTRELIEKYEVILNE